MAVRRAVKMPSDGVPERLRAWLDPYADWNLFNPSIHSDNGVLHLAFRAFRGGERVKPFNAYYAYSSSLDGSLAPPDLVDLTEFAADHGISPVADPKLFGFDGGVFVTFNTGFKAEGLNHIYIMQVAPTLEPPQLCVLDQRHRIEKNWAFYERDGELRSLYSLSPLVRLRLEGGALGKGGELEFSREQTDAEASVSFEGRRYGLLGKRNLSIGTQPVVSDEGLLLIAHEKIYLSKWRGYVGRLVRIDDVADIPAVDVLPDRLIHSFGAAVPRFGEHNRIALFVTYFAGLTWHDGRILTSYGINDNGFGFAQVPEAVLQRS